MDVPRGRALAASLAYEVVEQGVERTRAGREHALGRAWNGTARRR